VLLVTVVVEIKDVDEVVGEADAAVLLDWIDVELLV
jgi:hypothetical protein